MTTEAYEYKSDFARRHFARGRAAGLAEVLLEKLTASGIEVSDDTRTRITECTDHDQLLTWIRRAVTAGSTTDLFD